MDIKLDKKISYRDMRKKEEKMRHQVRDSNTSSQKSRLEKTSLMSEK